MARRILYLLLAAAVILWLGQGTDLDMRLARAAFDARTGSFPWRHAWLADVFSHQILRAWLTGAGLACIALAVADALADRWAGRRLLSVPLRPRLRVLAWSALLVPSLVALLKRSSASHCPWDLQAFGGTEVYVRLLQPVGADAAYGHCLPAGHASSALWLLALVVFWLPGRPRRAAVAGGIALCLGAGMGWLQQMRGAHFLTHTLWSVWIATAVVSLLYWQLIERPAMLGPEQKTGAPAALHAPQDVVAT